MAGHVAPEATTGGPIAAIGDGDTITFDLPNRRLDVALSDDEIAARRQTGAPPPPATQPPSWPNTPRSSAPPKAPSPMQSSTESDTTETSPVTRWASHSLVE